MHVSPETEDQIPGYHIISKSHSCCHRTPQLLVIKLFSRSHSVMVHGLKRMIAFRLEAMGSSNGRLVFFGGAEVQGSGRSRSPGIPSSREISQAGNQTNGPRLPLRWDIRSRWLGCAQSILKSRYVAYCVSVKPKIQCQTFRSLPMILNTEVGVHTFISMQRKTSRGRLTSGMPLMSPPPPPRPVSPHRAAENSALAHRAYY